MALDRGGMNSPRRVLGGAVMAAGLLATFLIAAGRMAPASSVAPAGQPARAAAGADRTGAEGAGADAPSGYVIRTAPLLDTPATGAPSGPARGSVGELAGLLAARGADRAWVQVKQDENEEHPSGTLFFPSALAPVAPGYADGRLSGLVDALTARGVRPIGWMPVLHDASAAAAHPQWSSQRITETGTLERDPNWLCPFEPAVRAHQASIAAEAVRTLPGLQGLYLDFVRYDDDFSCASPAALAELDRRTGWRRTTGVPLSPADVRRAASASDATGRTLWRQWHQLRAEQISATVTEIRSAVQAVRPGLPVGAFVLPFSAGDYLRNTQSGQDLDALAGTGLAEIALMAYWDDWDQSPAWVAERLRSATDQVAGRVPVSVVLDGDMGVRSTRLTLEALDGAPSAAVSWFLFDPWTEPDLSRLARAVVGHRREGPMPRPDRVSVVIRIDTEPDDTPSYAAVRPEMIDTLVDLFARKGVPATFLTVGRLAELQPDAVRRAAAAGHEIGSHSYDHEQIDSLPVPEQLVSVNRGLSSLRALGLSVHGFGAPRNSITPQARDALIAAGLEYDGSAAYDPLTSLIDVRYAERSDGGPGRIVVVPFVIPNDWDARVVEGLSADEMATAWIERLDAVVASGEPVFVLDVHQWSVSRPDDLAALSRFIDHAQACRTCRIETLRDAAAHARSVLDRYETP